MCAALLLQLASCMGGGLSDEVHAPQDLDTARGEMVESRDSAAKQMAALMAAVAVDNTSPDGKQVSAMQRASSAPAAAPRLPGARLRFAHAVTPLISDIGRNLASHCAAAFEPAPVKASAGS
jgi:hypothetical protein